MPDFLYKVRDETGKVFTGIIEAEDVRDVKQKLHSSGYYIVGVQPYGGEKKKFSLFREKVTLDTLIIFTRQLTSMVEAGLPILTCLDILWRQMDNARMQVVVSDMRNKLKGGTSIAEAINNFPDVFPTIYRALLSVAETGAGLVPILKKLSEYLNNQRVFIGKIKRAMTYPIIIIVFAVVVVLLMMVIVVPTLQKVLETTGVELPAITKFVIALSHFLRSLYFWIIAPAVGFAVWFAYKQFVSTPGGRLAMDKLKLKIPVLGQILLLGGVSRFTRSLGLLLGAGLPIVKSIEVAKATITNKHLEDSLDWVESRMVEGVPLSKALSETKVFPPLLIEMIAVGESSGTLIEMLDRISNYFEEELDAVLSKFLSMLEPMLMIFIGGIVVFVLLSIYLPIFAVWQGIGKMH